MSNCIDLLSVLVKKQMVVSDLTLFRKHLGWLAIEPFCRRFWWIFCHMISDLESVRTIGVVHLGPHVKLNVSTDNCVVNEKVTRFEVFCLEICLLLQHDFVGIKHSSSYDNLLLSVEGGHLENFTERVFRLVGLLKKPSN
jgi:hypothetical protein